MATKNPRINVTFEEITAALIMNLAHSQKKSVASFVRELALEALEQREDYYLSKFADAIDINGKETCSHEEAWK